MDSEESVRWKKGFGRHTLVAISREVCKDCLVKIVCLEVCIDYRLIHGIMIDWFKKQYYDVQENEFMGVLEETIKEIRA